MCTLSEKKYWVPQLLLLNAGHSSAVFVVLNSDASLAKNFHFVSSCWSLSVILLLSVLVSAAQVAYVFSMVTCFQNTILIFDVFWKHTFESIFCRSQSLLVIIVIWMVGHIDLYYSRKKLALRTRYSACFHLLAFSCN